MELPTLEDGSLDYPEIYKLIEAVSTQYGVFEYLKALHTHGRAQMQEEADEIQSLRKQLADLTGAECEPCEGDGTISDGWGTGPDCETCQGTGRIKTHKLMPLEPDEKILKVGMFCVKELSVTNFGSIESLYKEILAAYGEHHD